MSSPTTSKSSLTLCHHCVHSHEKADSEAFICKILDEIFFEERLECDDYEESIIEDRHIYECE